MRKLPLVLCAGVVLLSAGWRLPQGQQGTKRPVSIHFKCETGGGATVTINPWRRQLGARTDSIQWTLVTPGPGDSAPDSVLIAPKSVNQWPFTSGFPISVKTSKPGVAQGIQATVPAGTYKYSVTGICKFPGMAPDTVVIDPDMIIPT